MAGHLLNTLKGGGAKPAASHEARLGIMVITILVFAFGFLVYHKMDMHQRNLTQASIASNAGVQPDVPAVDSAAGLIGPSAVTAANDSIVNDPIVNIGDLSEGSPFSEPATATMNVTPALESRDESFASLDEPSLDEPSPAEPALPEPASAFERSAPSFERSASVEEPGAAAEPMIAMAEPSISQDNFFPDQDAIEPRPSASADAAQSTDELDNSFLRSGSTSETQMEAHNAPFPETKESPPAASSVADNSFDLSLPEPAFEPVDSVKTSAEEPVLLAMAEPQQGNDFLLDDSAVESSEPALHKPAVFPDHSGSDANSRMELSQQRREPESRGFNAVKNPSGRKDGNKIRTAAGSGSDGKFSLAAFNYQNGAAQAAPDDGSTFNSVVVQDGDNYTKISKRAYGSVKFFSALAVFNQHRIPEPKNMRPGMVVLVPEKEVLEERYPELFVDSQPKVAELPEFFLLEDGSPAYRVGERETISQIAERFLGRSSRWIEIYRLNQSVLKDPNKLKAGLILALPADAAEVNVVQ